VTIHLTNEACYRFVTLLECSGNIEVLRYFLSKSADVICLIQP